MGGLKVKKEQSTDLLQKFCFAGVRNKATVAYSATSCVCHRTKQYGQEGRQVGRKKTNKTQKSLCAYAGA